MVSHLFGVVGLGTSMCDTAIHGFKKVFDYVEASMIFFSLFESKDQFLALVIFCMVCCL